MQAIYRVIISSFLPTLFVWVSAKMLILPLMIRMLADFNDPLAVKVVSLDTACRQQQVNDGCFAQLNNVPTQALTLTVPALMAGKFVYCMVPGEKKAQAVFHTLNSGVTEKYPSTIYCEDMPVPCCF